MLWLMPMKQVAAHYDATHHQLKVFCTKYGIPTPPSVYSLNPGQQPPPFVGTHIPTLIQLMEARLAMIIQPNFPDSRNSELCSAIQARLVGLRLLAAVASSR